MSRDRFLFSSKFRWQLLALAFRGFWLGCVKFKKKNNVCFGMHHKMFNSDKVQFESSLSEKQPKIARSRFFRRAWTPCFRKNFVYFWKSPRVQEIINFMIIESSHKLNIWWFIKIGLRKWFFFWCQGFFSWILILKRCKNEFQDNKEKSCSWFKKKVPQKIEFSAVWTHVSHPTALTLKVKRKLLISAFKKHLYLHSQKSVFLSS